MVEANDNTTILENAFDSIRLGNKYEDAKEFWKATQSFEDARRLLNDLSIQNASSESTEEHQKLTELYKQQAAEYLNRARNCFVNDLKQDCKLDEYGSVDSDSSSFHQERCELFSEEECMQRISLFGRLFVKDLSDLPINQISSQRDDFNIEDKESSLEDRFMQLNKSMPKTCKSDDERMRDLNRSLGRIGLSLYTDTKPAFNSAFAIDPPKSESDQIEDVIALARDEVALIGSHPYTSNITETGQSSSADDVPKNRLLLIDDVSYDEDLSDNDGDSTEDDADVDFTPETCKELQEIVAEVQLSMAELNALLDVDKDGDAAIQFDQISGKRALKKAISLLFQVKKKWNVHEN